MKYTVVDVFTYFQKARGKTVEYFWKRLNEENLGYLRGDKLRTIMDRRKIKGRIECDYAVNLIVTAKQEGRVTEEESKLLSNMIGDFENRKKK